jgi:hypothetical protein
MRAKSTCCWRLSKHAKPGTPIGALDRGGGAGLESGIGEQKAKL